MSFRLTLAFDRRSRTRTAGGFDSIPVKILGDPGPKCRQTKFEGTVAKRIFDDDALNVTGFVLEVVDGTREYVNVAVLSPRRYP